MNYEFRTPIFANSRAAENAVEALRADEKMARLMPNAMRLTELRKDCTTILPKVFEVCEVQRYESGQLILSVPNAALVTRLKQQVPKLQEALQQRGWQVEKVRLKVQMQQKPASKYVANKPPLPQPAKAALSELVGSLEKTSQNAALEEALQRMLKRHA